MIQNLLSYLENMDNTNKVIITIIFIILILIIFARKFKMKDTDYNSQQYWEDRYDYYTKQFDWYVSLQEICYKVKLNEIEKKLPNKKKAKIIELGCGNSQLSYEV